MGEGDEHEEEADPVDSVGRDPGIGASVAALTAHHVEDLALPIADQAVDPIPEPGRASGQVGPAPQDPLAAGQAAQVADRLVHC